MQRRGFLGRLLGGAVITALVPAHKVEAKIVPGIDVPADFVLPKLPPGRVEPVREITRDWTVAPNVDGGYVHSRYTNHRIQIEPTRAIQFRHGHALVSGRDAWFLQQTSAHKNGDIWFDGELPYVKPAEDLKVMRDGRVKRRIRR